MTKRTIQHQLEDFSIRKFGLAMPKQWVFREKDKDYGIDGEVELFDSEERATGLVFWVQLKATSSKQAGIIRGVDLSLETIKYYKRLDIPVLIARYSEHENIFYVKWDSEIDPFYARDSAKTMRVSFSESDILDEEKINEIKKYLTKLRAMRSGAIKLPIGVNLSFGSNNICGVDSSILLSRIRSKINQFNNILRLEVNQDSLSADVFIDENTLKVGFLDIAGCTFHDVDLMDAPTLAEDLIKDISLALSIALSWLGYSDLAARIVFSNDLPHRLKIKDELLQYLSPSLLETSYFKETLELVGEVCDEADNNFLETSTNALLLFLRNSNDVEKLNATETFLKKNVERYKDSAPNLYGISQYNLGNFYGSIDRFNEAVKCLLLARRYQPKYYNQDYFYGELAGSLFELGKFIFAAKFYKKALDLGGSKEWRPLYADSLMFSGQYQESLDVFEEYLSDTKDQTAEWHLKFIYLSKLIKKHNIKSQYRNIRSALEFSDVRSVSNEEVEAQLEKALKQDLLCGLAWFNLAHFKNISGQIKEATFCFTMCALVQRWDIEAWVNATACSFNNIVPIEICALLVRAGYFCNGERYIEALYKLIEDRLGSESLSQIAQAIEQLISEDRKSNTMPELRMLNEDGKFENILANKDA